MRNCPVLLIAKRKTSKRESQNTHVYTYTQDKSEAEFDLYILRYKSVFLFANISSITRIMQAFKLMMKEKVSFLLNIRKGRCIFKYLMTFFKNIFNEEIFVSSSSLNVRRHYAYRIYIYTRYRKRENIRTDSLYL